jgi:hypothetical protein
MDEKELEALKLGASLMYETLNTVFLLHDSEEMEGENTAEAIEGCKHCSALADAIVHYPCPTVQLLLQDFTVEEPTEEEETPAE